MQCNLPFPNNLTTIPSLSHHQISIRIRRKRTPYICIILPKCQHVFNVLGCVHIRFSLMTFIFFSRLFCVFDSGLCGHCRLFILSISLTRYLCENLMKHSLPFLIINKIKINQVHTCFIWFSQSFTYVP